MEKAKVYFTKTITPENVIRMYEALGQALPGKVAVKVHSGEKGNQNFLRPEFMKPMIEAVNGTVVECNTAYGGERNTTDKHVKLMEYHGWSHYFDVDIMDAEGPDLELEIPNGKQIKKNYVGKHLSNYDSMLVLSHFKGHPMGGFGGALKQLSIGCASSAGKSYIHSAGKVTDQDILWQNVAPPGRFPGEHGRCRQQRGQALRRQHGLRQHHVQHERGLRLLRRCRGSLHEGHRHSVQPGPCGSGSGLH